MRTAKKASKAKTKTKLKGKAPQAVAKAKARATAKAKLAVPRRQATPKGKAPVATNAKPKSAAKAKVAAKTAPAKTVRAKTAPAKAGLAKTKPRSASTRARKPPPRRDGSGRLDPRYARDLRTLSRENNHHSDDRAFFSTPRSGDDLAEELGEEAVETMTSGEDQSDHLTGQEVEEERGGPFVRTRADDEFADGTDRSNPIDATREPFPRT